MSYRELLVNGDFTDRDLFPQVDVAGNGSSRRSGRWYLIPHTAGQHPTAWAGDGHLRVRLDRGDRMQQLLAAPQAEVLLTLSIRVVSGQLKLGAVDRDRPGQVITLSVDGNQPRQISSRVAGPVNQVVFYAADNNTVFDLWNASLATETPPAADDTAAAAAREDNAAPDNPLARLVAIAIPDANTRSAIQAELTAPRASLATVATALQAQPGRAEDANAVSFVRDLVPITGDDEALIAVLLAHRRSGELADARSLAAYTPRQWTALLDAAHPEPATTDQRATVQRLTAAAQTAYPGRALLAAVQNNPASSLHRPDLLAFFDDHPDVDLVTTPLHSVPALTTDAALRSELERIQRLARVTSVHNHVDQLNKAGYRSASAITRKGRSAFVAAHAPALGGTAAATTVYEKAALTSSRAFALYARHSPTFNRHLPRVLAPADNSAQDTIPDWRQLFGDQLDLVTDDPGRTAFSPAAYLTDLLSFLDNQKPAADGSTQSGLDALTHSRPDLIQLALDHSNTTIELPMLDLVNELLECAVLAEDPTPRQPFWCTSAPPDGTTDTQTGPWTEATVTTEDPAPWGDSGSADHQTTAAADYHSHGFAVTDGAAGLPLAPGDMIGVWVRPKADTPPGQVVLTVSIPAGRRQLLWGYTPNDATWVADPTALQVGLLPALARWSLLTVNADTIGANAAAITGLEFGCVDGAVDWGPAGSYPPAPPTTTADDSPRRRNQPQLVRNEAYDAIADDLYPWATTPLDLGYRTARLASQALGVDLAEMVAAFTSPNQADELTDVRVATTLLGIGPRLHAVLLGTDGATEQAHWGPFDPAGGDWFQQLLHADTFLPRAGLTAAQMRTPPGALTSYGLALNPVVTDQETGDTDLVVNGLSEATLPYLRRFLRLWRAFGGDPGPLERFYHSLGDKDPVGGWPTVGDTLLTDLALAQRLLGRLDAELVTIASWWTPLLDNAGLVDPSVYPDDGPASAANSPYSRTFLNPDLGDLARVFALTGDEIADQIPLLDAIPAIAAALGASAADLALLIASTRSGIVAPPPGAGLRLTRQALSAIHRAISFTQAAELSMADYLSLRELTNLDPFDPAAPATTLLFLDAADDIRTAGFTIAELDYLLAGTHRAGTDFSRGSPADLVTTLVAGLTQLRQVHQMVPDPNGDVLRRELVARQCPVSPDDVLAAIDGTGHYAVTLATDPELTPEDANLVTWQAGELTSGVLTTADRDAILRRHADPTVQAAVRSLFQVPRTVITAVPGLRPETINALLDGATAPDQRHQSVLTDLVPSVLQMLGTTLIVTALADRTLLDTEVIDQVLTAMTDLAGTPVGTSLLALSTTSTPADLDAAADIVTHIDKIARICAIGRLTPAQTRFTLTHAGTTGWLNLLTLLPTPDAAVDFTGWQRLTRYLAFRNRIGDWNDTLLSIFRTAANPPAADADLATAQTAATTAISTLTGWPMESLTDLHRLLGLTYPTDYCDERSLLRLERAIAVSRDFGAEATRIAGWSTTLGTTATGSDMLAFAHAATRANPEALRPIEDSLRRLRRDALVNHLFPPTTSVPSGDAALARFLIDTEVDVNRSTTRIAAATQSVQLFVQRSLLDLDTRLTLSPDARQEWSWLDGYTSWSAARLVFLYPENVVTPDVRSGLTAEFSRLKSDLQQGDLDNLTTQNALTSYLHSVDAISNLQCAALYQETQVAGGTMTGSVLHVVARTRATPYHYFYRRRDALGLWNPWEDIGVDIDSENLVLYVLDRRLHLFSLQVASHVEQAKMAPATMQAGSPTARPRWEARLAWTTRDLTGWTPKQLSPEAIPTRDLGGPDIGTDLILLDVRFSPAGQSVPELNLPVRQAYERTASLYVPLELAAFDFAGAGQRVSVAPSTVEPGSIEYLPPIGRGLPGGTAFPDPTVSYQAWLVSRGLAFPHILPPDPSGRQSFTYNYLFNTTPDAGSRVLGASSTSSLARGAQYAVDPTLPFAFEPPGFPLLGYPTVLTDSLTTYSFEICYHPYTKSLKRAVLTEGVDALFKRQNQVHADLLPSDRMPLTFSDLGPTATVTTTVLSETLDFEAGGYFSTYNWELFYHAPRLIARELTAAQRFDEAKTWLEYVFDPLDRSDEPAPRKYWQTKPLYAAVNQSVADLLQALDGQPDSAGEKQVALWRANPFDPDVIAMLRPEAYQKATVMAYLDNLIAWGDWHFAKATSEDLAKATQLYLFAGDLLGPAPQSGSPPGPTAPESNAECFAGLRNRLDSFSDAVVALENRMSVWTSSPNAPPGYGPAPTAVLPPALYFSVPPNPTLTAYWSTIADRLSKLREGESLTGQPLQFAPYPGVGNPTNHLGAGSIAGAATAVARPVYRFSTLVAKAQELCGDVRNLGSVLLSVLEKQDAEALAALRATQELALLRSARGVRVGALLEAAQQITQLHAAYAVAADRYRYYSSREPHNQQELDQVAHLQTSAALQATATGLEALGTAFSFIPQATVGVSGVASPVITATIGGRELGEAASLVARIVSGAAGLESHFAAMASLSGGWARRWDDWQFQISQAHLEMTQITAQITAAQTRHQQAQQELDGHDQQIANATQVQNFLHSKYTNAELYGWMVSQLSAVYASAYRLAVATARRAEDAFRWELMPDPSTFIQSTYWTSTRSGLLAGERLSYDLREMEMAFLERNARQFEITKHISLAMADPLALVQLRTTGQCTFTVPESWFDLDYPGHYLRRIRRVAISVPCVTGPYTGVHCTLSLQSDKTRVDPSLAGGATWVRSGQADPRFVDRYGLTEVIVTSGGLDQSGTFSAGGDDRFDPFEGAGAETTWLIDLPTDTNAFDRDSITDVVLHLSYTARDAGAAARAAARKEVVTPMRQVGTVLLTAGHNFPQPWQQLLSSTADPRVLTLPVTLDLLPTTAAATSVVSRLRIYLETASAATLTMAITSPGGAATSVDLRADASLPGLLVAVLDLTAAPAQPGALGSWTMRWAPAALTAAAPTNMLILADYEPRAATASARSRSAERQQRAVTERPPQAGATPLSPRQSTPPRRRDQ